MFLLLVRAFWLFMEPHKNTINTSVFKLVCGFLLQMGGVRIFLLTLDVHPLLKFINFNSFF